MAALTKHELALINKNAPFPTKNTRRTKMAEADVKAPSSDEINRLRRDASEGDANAAAFFRNKDNADEALERWRKTQPS